LSVTGLGSFTNNGVSVGHDLTLDAVGGNSTANVLSNAAGTISGTSTFLYSGAAAVSTPATLASTRAIGFLKVQNGVLELASSITTGTDIAAGGADSVTVNSGGTLMLGSSFILANTTAAMTVSGGGKFDLNGNAQTLGAVTLGDTTGGGTITSAGTTGAAASATLTATSLTVGGNSTSTIASNAVVAANATLGGTSTLIVSGSLSGTATVAANTTLSGGGGLTAANINAAGTLAANTPNLSIGTLSLASSGTFALSITTASGTTSAVTASNLTLTSGAVLTIADTGASTTLSTGTVFDFLNYSGAAITSGFNYGGSTLGNNTDITVGNNTYLFSYDNGGQDEMTLTVAAIPEPGAWASMLCGMAMLVVWQRRKRRPIRT
jgi:hypothetical protein